MIYKSLNRKQKIEQQGHGMISGERVAVHAPEVTLIVLLLLLLLYEFTVDRKDCQ
jgi:hypothetical protein